MKRVLTVLIAGMLLNGCNDSKGAFLESFESENSLEVAVSKFETLVKEQGLTHFYTIDHKQNATNVNMDLKPNSVVVFGNPKMGTVLMDCNPSMGLELPLKMHFNSNYIGETTIMFTNPEYWSLKHNIKDRNCLEVLNKAKTAMTALAIEAGKK